MGVALGATLDQVTEAVRIALKVLQAEQTSRAKDAPKVPSPAEFEVWRLHVVLTGHERWSINELARGVKTDGERQIATPEALDSALGPNKPRYLKTRRTRVMQAVNRVRRFLRTGFGEAWQASNKQFRYGRRHGFLTGRRHVLTLPFRSFRRS